MVSKTELITYNNNLLFVLIINYSSFKINQMNIYKEEIIIINHIASLRNRCFLYYAAVKFSVNIKCVILIGRDCIMQRFVGL